MQGWLTIPNGACSHSGGGGGREVVVIDPDDWSVETHDNRDGKGPAIPDAIRSRVYSKWAYIADYDVFMGYNDHRHGVWFYRLADR